MCREDRALADRASNKAGRGVTHVAFPLRLRSLRSTFAACWLGVPWTGRAETVEVPVERAGIGP